MSTDNQSTSYLIEVPALKQIFDALKGSSHRIIGPVASQNAIKLQEVSRFNELARGHGDETQPGSYRLNELDKQAYFGFLLPVQSFKPFIYPAEHTLWKASRKNGEIQVKETETEQEPMAFWGIRACDLAALRVLDRVFDQPELRHAPYHRNRKHLFVLAVACTTHNETCFCATMDTGPVPGEGADLVLTELLDENQHVFTAEACTQKAVRLMESIDTRPLDEKLHNKAQKLLHKNREAMGVRFDRKKAALELKNNYHHPEWEAVAQRCLSCGNCTLTCPTCFCNTIIDRNSLTGSETSRLQQWDSCFNGEFTYMHGGPVRQTIRSRYRQWLMHKLSHWYDQFDCSGCVGCGRCITWCPVGIDITEETNVLME